MKSKQFYKRPLVASALCAAMFLSACSETDPEVSGAQYLERAKAYQQQGQYKAAMIEYKNALQTSGNQEALSAYADMLNEMGRHRAALAQLEAAVEASAGSGNQSDESVYESVESYVGLNKYRSAEQALKALSDETSPRYRLYQAKILSGKGDLRGAQKSYRMVIDSEAADSEFRAQAYIDLAAIQAQQGKASLALTTLNEVLESSNVYPEALVVRAGIQINEGDLEKAEETLSEALSRQPTTDIMLPEKALVLERLAYVLTRLGRSNEAYIYQKLLAEAFPGASEVAENYQSALEAFEKRDLTQARATLEGILAEYPSHSRSKQLLGVISYLEGDTKEAASHLDESVDPEVVDPFTRNIYAANTLKLNDPIKVLEILGPDAGKSDTPQTLSLYGLASIANGQGDRGEAALKKAAELAPENVPVRLALASYYRQLVVQGQADRAKDQWAMLEQAYKLDPTDQKVLTDIVSYHLSNGGAAAAEKFLAANLKDHPEAYASNLVAGYYQLSARNVAKALSYFEASLKTKGEADDYSEAIFAKGRSELALKKFDDAKRSFEDLVRIKPSSFYAYQGLYFVLSQQEGSSAASDRLEQLAKRNAVLEPYLVLIRTALAKNDFAQADRYLDSARVLDADSHKFSEMSASLRLARAQHAIANARFDDARGLMSGLLSERPDSVRLLGMLVELEIRDGKLTEAAKVIGQIERLNPVHPIIGLLKGDLSVQKQDFAAAKEHFRSTWLSAPTELVAEKLFRVIGFLGDRAGQAKFLEEWQETLPNSTSAMLLSAIKFQERGQRIKAAELYEKLLALAPNNVPALNNLGWIYFEKGDERSIPTLERAAQLAPQNAAVLDSLGWVLFKNGRVEEGRDYLKRAKDLAPDNAEIQGHYKEASKG